MLKSIKVQSTRFLIVMLCAGGAWISGELLKVHAGPWPTLKGTAAPASALCGGEGGAEPGCKTVLRSDYGSIDFHLPMLDASLTPHWRRVVIPVAFIGLSYFIVFGVWFTFAGPVRSWHKFYFIPLLGVLGGVLGSVGFVALMFVKLDAMCPWCLVVHAINGCLLIGVIHCRPARMKRPRDDTVAPSPIGGVSMLDVGGAVRVMAMAVVVIAGMWMYRASKLETRRQVAKFLPYMKFVEDRVTDHKFVVREFYAQPVNRLLLQTSCPESMADSSVPCLVVFSDFACPHCGCFASKWRSTLRDHWLGSIDVDFRHLPLDQSCNPDLVKSLHPRACEASYAAEAARLQAGQDGFWRMHDHLFAYMRRVNTESLEDLASKLGLNGKQLLADMDGEQVRDRIAADIQLAESLGVHRTPAVFLNGRRVPDYYLHNPVFWEAISTHGGERSRVARSESPDVARFGSDIDSNTELPERPGP